MTNKDHSQKLTPIQKQFTMEYPLDFNGTEAYLRASASVGGQTTTRKSASVQSCKLLKLPKITEMIDAYVQEQLGPLEKDLLGNVKFWIEVRDGITPGVGKGPLIPKEEVLKLIDPDEYPELYDAINLINSFEVPDVRIADRVKASEMLAKYRSMFVEKKEIKGNVSVKIVDDI